MSSDCCNTGSTPVTPVGPKTFATEPSQHPLCPEKDLIVWERQISETVAEDVGQAKKFFIAKYPIQIVRISGEVEDEAVEVEIRIDGSKIADLNINSPRGDCFYVSVEIDRLIPAGSKMEVVIPTQCESGISSQNLVIELLGYPVWSN